MFKRGVLYILLSILAVSCVYALHDVSIDITPNSSYEGLDTYFDLEIWNKAGSDTITNVTLELPGYTIINASSTVPNTINSNTSITWYKDIPASWIAHVFFWAKADFIDMDTPYNWTITTYDDNLGINLNSVIITALNDTVGPEVLTFPNNPIQRGENFTISAVVFDSINKIERVYADINFPDGATDSFDLSLDNGTYYGTYQTNNNHPEGIYNIDVYGIDDAGNSNSNTTSINVESYYNLFISLSKTNPLIGEFIDVLGNITFDNSSIVSNVDVNIYYPNNFSTVTSDVNGNFIFNFQANEAGNVSANTTNPYSKVFESNLESYTVSSPPPAPTGSSGGSSGSNHKQCEENWICMSWGECIDEVQTRKCSDYNECGTIEDKPETERTCVIPEETKEETEDSNVNNQITGFAVGDIIKSKPIMTILVLILVSALGFSAYWFIFRKKKETYGF